MSSKVAGVLLLVITLMGSLSIYRHRKGERLKREVEVKKAAAAVIEDRTLTMTSAAIRLESALRKKNVQTDLVAAINVNAETQNLQVVVTKRWLDQPEQAQKQMAQAMVLVLKGFSPPDGIPFVVVDEAGGFYKGGVRWWE